MAGAFFSLSGDGRSAFALPLRSTWKRCCPWRSGRFSMNHSSWGRFFKSCNLSSTSGSRVSTANSGIKPHHRAISSGKLSLRQLQHVVENPFLPRSTHPMLCRPAMGPCGGRCRYEGGAQKLCWPHLRYQGSLPGSSAIPAVQRIQSPSRWWFRRLLDVAAVRQRPSGIESPMLSRPRNVPGNILPSCIFTVSPTSKVQQHFMKNPL